jgi:2-methylcitrate dehydratase PrpD
VHYTAAAILHDRALTLAQFEPNRYDDPTLRSFATEKVEVRADAGVSGSQAKVDVDLNDGTTLSAFCAHPLGGRDNPLSRAQIEGKFRSYAAGVLPDSAIADVVGAVDRLEDFGSVRKLMALLRVAAKTASRPMAAAE